MNKITQTMVATILTLALVFGGLGSLVKEGKKVQALQLDSKINFLHKNAKSLFIIKSDDKDSKNDDFGIVPEYMKMSKEEFQKEYWEAERFLQNNKDSKIHILPVEGMRPFYTVPRFGDEDKELKKIIHGYTKYKQYNFQQRMVIDNRESTIAEVGCLLTAFTNAYNKYVSSRERLDPAEMIAKHRELVDKNSNFLWFNAQEILLNKINVKIFQSSGKVSLDAFRKVILLNLIKGDLVIAKLRKNGKYHFVLCVGFERDDSENFSIYIEDPDDRLYNEKLHGFDILNTYSAHGWSLVAIAQFSQDGREVK